MRRVYVLLAAAVIAATLIAIAVGPAGAAPTQASKRYVAIAVNEYTNKVFWSYAQTKGQSTYWAKNQCVKQSGNSIDEYCEGTGWVRDGWIALQYENFYDDGRKNHWGVGWSDIASEANANANKYCKQGAKYDNTCELKKILETSRQQGATSGGTW